MSNRNLDASMVTRRVRDKNQAQSLYRLEQTSQRIIYNANTNLRPTDISQYRMGVETTHARGLIGSIDIINVGGIANFVPGPMIVPPSPPTNLSGMVQLYHATAQVLISFTPGASGTSPITNYQYSINGRSPRIFSPEEVDSPVLITRLTIGRTYSIVLQAISEAGVSHPSVPYLFVAAVAPSAPFIVSTTGGNATILVFVIEGFNGGSPINNYKYSTDGGLTYSFFSVPQVSSLLTITTVSTDGVTPLSNNESYMIVLRAYSSFGSSPLSNSVAAYTYVSPPTPTNLSAPTGNGSIQLSFTQPTPSYMAPIQNYQYSMDGETFTAFDPPQTESPLTISGLPPQTTYSVQIKAVNVAGISDPTDSISVSTYPLPLAPTNLTYAPGNGQVILTFVQPTNSGLPITNYQYSLNSADVVPLIPPQKSSPLRISYLTNDMTYTISIQAISDVGPSASSSTLTVKTYTTPQPPTSLSSTPGNGSLRIAFTPGASGNAPITNYQYSVDGVTYMSLYPPSASSPITIPCLSNLTIYTISLRAVSPAGSSAGSSSISAPTLFYPQPPSGLSSTPGNGQFSLAFTPGSNGGSPITNYMYSLNNGPYLLTNSTTSPFTITGLTNSTTYQVNLKAVNVVGDSIPSLSIYASTISLSGPPTNLAATFGLGQVTIAFTPGVSIGNPITNYAYSLNGGAYTAVSPPTTTGPVTITGLSANETYKISMKSITALGMSATYSSLYASTFSVARPPTNLASTPGNGQVTIAFTAGDNGGSSITNYQYSINGGSYVALSPASAISPITITGLANNTTYQVTLQAINSVGAGGSSAAVSASTFSSPQPPVGLFSTAGNAQVSISFSATSNGGSPITNYQYAVNGGAYTACSPAVTTSPVIITGLANNTSYQVTLKAVTIVGPSVASSAVTASTFNSPAAPTLLSTTTGNGQISISFSPNGNGGSPITNYQYSVNGTNYNNMNTTTSPYTIPNLSNDTSYPITLKAVSAVGAGAASASLTGSTFTTPQAPINLSSTAGNLQVTIAFTPQGSGSSPIVNYQYSVNGGTYVLANPAIKVSPVIITGLTNNTTYRVQLKAVSAAGAGAASAAISASTLTKVPPDAPVITSVSIYGNQVKVQFTQGSAGSAPITNYQYSVNGGAYVLANVTVSPFYIYCFSLGSNNSVRLQAISSIGASAASNSYSYSIPTFSNQANTPTYISNTRLTGGPSWSQQNTLVSNMPVSSGAVVGFSISFTGYDQGWGGNDSNYSIRIFDGSNNDIGTIYWAQFPRGQATKSGSATLSCPIVFGPGSKIMRITQSPYPGDSYTFLSDSVQLTYRY